MYISSRYIFFIYFDDKYFRTEYLFSSVRVQLLASQAGHGAGERKQEIERFLGSTPTDGARARGCRRPARTHDRKRT